MASALASWGRSRRRHTVGWAALIAGALLALAAVLDAIRPHARPGVIRTISLGPVAVTVATIGSTGRAFIAAVDANDDGSSIVTIDMHSGLVVRTTRVGELPSAVAVDNQTQRVFVANENCASVSMLDARSGRILRTLIPGCSAGTACTPAMGAPPAALVIDAGTDRVFVDGAIAGYGVASVVDAHTGALLHIDGGPSAVSIGGGPMEVDARRGRVYALGTVAETRMSVLDTRSGIFVHAIPVGPYARAVTVDERTGRIFVLSDRGLVIIDARSERLLHTRAISSAANDMVVDEARGHVVVADATGTGSAPTTGDRGHCFGTLSTVSSFMRSPSIHAAGTSLSQPGPASTCWMRVAAPRCDLSL